ncbi:hypothetical protein KEM48_007137 [Puccinia striiformis f. sp. tritici PST-130]|nr:hypothetical protein KEM48_007137 [Puccinia striiformis f. sp. tritici PST-130]
MMQWLFAKIFDPTGKDHELPLIGKTQLKIEDGVYFDPVKFQSSSSLEVNKMLNSYPMELLGYGSRDIFIKLISSLKSLLRSHCITLLKNLFLTTDIHPTWYRRSLCSGRNVGIQMNGINGNAYSGTMDIYKTFKQEELN